MRNPDATTRQVLFDRVGLTADVPPLTVDFTAQHEFHGAIARYAAAYLAPTTAVQVDAHPDCPDGVLYALLNDGDATIRGPVLGRLTVALPRP